MEKERIIVSLTTWEKRIKNIPVILDTVFRQTLLPDITVLNISEDLQIPEDVMEYLTNHTVEINRVPYKKVYKKLIPTLKEYPNDCVINIDDDWLYPPTMIEDFWSIHQKYPSNPISGNREFVNGLTSHCGCASLTKASFFENLDLIDQDVMDNCISDDTVYTFFSARAGFPYVWTSGLYYTNMQPYNAEDSYSVSDIVLDAVGLSWAYLTRRFGETPSMLELLIKDKKIVDIVKKRQELDVSSAIIEGKRMVRSTKTYKLGYSLLKPLNWIFHKK